MNCLFECFDQLYDRISQHGWKSLVITPPVTWRVKWLEDGRRYEGEWHNYKRYPHGQGRMEFVDGEIYDGDWEAGVKTGVGLGDFPDGSQYDGDYLNENFDG